MDFKNRQHHLFIIATFISIASIMTWHVSSHIFFWDTVQLGAKHGIHFYETRFAEILLPDTFDSGHVPIFGMYLALMWIFFRKSLFVSHFVMLHFLIGIIFQAYFLIKRFVPDHDVPYALVLFLIQPTLLGQSVLVSPDIPLVFFFLLALNGVLCNRRVLLLLGIVGLFLISMRGAMLSFGILLLDLYFNFKQYKSSYFITLCKMSLSYLPGFILFGLYNYFHYVQKGWIGYHEGSPWAESFQHVDIFGFLRNIIILGWRLLDFGNIFLWITGLWLLYRHFSVLIKDKRFINLVIVFVVILGCLSVSFLSYNGLNAHRYILPVYLTLSLLVIYILFNTPMVIRFRIYTILCLGLLSGHLWIYPPHIAQGWDASLAHLPYYGLRDKILQDMMAQNIGIEEVACVFPNQSEMRYMDLTESKLKHTSFDHITTKYVLYSNVFNDYTDEDIHILGEKFKVLNQYERFGVFMTLYERR